MEDISIELWEKINNDFREAYSNNAQIKALLEKVALNKADYTEATEYSELVGRLWSDALTKYLKAENLPDGKLYFNIANKTIRPAFEADYSDVVEFTRQVQNFLNTNASIGLQAVIPPLDESRIKNLIDKIASQDELFDDTEWLIESAVVENYSRSIVTDFINVNALFQSDAGLHSWIERKEGAGGCCAWCRSMAGRYEYGEQPLDFFRVHKDCNCFIEFHPAKKPIQKITYGGRAKSKAAKFGKQTIEI